jgi:hypothetical protein
VVVRDGEQRGVAAAVALEELSARSLPTAAA